MSEKGYTIVNTPEVSFKGRAEDGIRIFRGIRYARCERFRKSEPADLKGACDATHRGTVCPQRSDRMASVIGGEYGSQMDENNLHLSIYSPEDACNLPVMVWIHGGSYLKGGSEERRYSGRRLVKEGNVVVVKISYRLGALGYLWWDKAAENSGLEDQKLALRWIQDNIRYFGGDKSKICLFGQSAGAHSIAAIMASCQDSPPFRRVILQSPPLGITMNPLKASYIRRRFLRILGKDPYKADIEEILDTQDRLRNMNEAVPFMPVMDVCHTIAEPVVKSEVEIVIGYAAYDSAPMLQKVLGSLFETFIGKAVINFFTDKVFIRPIRKYASLAGALGLKVQVYEWNWYPEGGRLKACHCIELPFILGKYEDWASTTMLNSLGRDEFDLISSHCLRAWTNFAKYGEFTDKEMD